MVVTNGRPTGEAATRAIGLPTLSRRLGLPRLGRVQRWLAATIAAAVVVAALVVGVGRTSAFSLQRIDVAGASASQAAVVRRALAARWAKPHLRPATAT